jgi:hypothetical protein
MASHASATILRQISIPHTLLLGSYTVYATFAWGGALGEFDAFVHSSAGPLPSETMDELAD